MDLDEYVTIFYALSNKEMVYKWGKAPEGIASKDWGNSNGVSVKHCESM